MLRVDKNQYMEMFAEKFTPHGLEHSYNHMCYIVEDIIDVARQLETKGLTLFCGPSFIGQPLNGPYLLELLPGGNLSFYITDPEGNELEFMLFTDDSQEMKYEKEQAGEIQN